VIIKRISEEQAARGVRVECQIVFWEDVATFRERVVIMDNTDILVSMYGTASMFSVFLRQGAVFLLIGLDSSQVQSMGNEFEPVYSHYTHVSLVVYRPESHSYVIPPPRDRTENWPDFGLNITYTDFRPFVLRAFNELRASGLQQP
jgi:hypothetical protein